MRFPRNPLLRLVTLAALTALVTGGVALPATVTPRAAAAEATAPTGGDATGPGLPCRGPKAVCQNRLLFGLSTPDAPTMGSTFTNLERSLGTRASLVGTYQDFTEPIYVRRLNKMLRTRHTPLVTWEPFRSTARTKNAFPLAKIAAGKYDRYLKEQAREARRVKGQFIIRFGHEMNGFWYPWGQPRALHPQSVAAPTNTPAAYRAAYRHIVQVFNRARAHNVVWMWSPNVVDANPAITLRSLYPGSKYVDVVGLSGYLSTTAETFDRKYRDTLNQITATAPTKPVIVAETGVVISDQRPTQMADLISGLVTIPNFAGLVYFSHPDRNVNYQIDPAHSDVTALGSLLDEYLIETPLTEVALPYAPTVSGHGPVPFVGVTLTAQHTWRGNVTASTSQWRSCPTTTYTETECAVVGEGDQYQVALSDRGRYLFNTFTVTSATTTRAARSAPVGPIRAEVPAAPVAGIDLLAESVRVRFGPAPEGATHWLVSLDGADPVYLTAAATEHYLNGLPLGSSHTVTVSLCDCPYKGATSTYQFGVVTRPDPATVTTTTEGNSATPITTVALPPTQPSQTGWLINVDGAVTQTGLVARHTLTGLSSGHHTVTVARLAGDGRTNPSNPTSFTTP